MHPAKATAIMLVGIAFLGLIALRINEEWDKRQAKAPFLQGEASPQSRNIENSSGITWVQYVVTEYEPTSSGSRRTILYMNDGQTIFICGWVAIPAGGCVDTLVYKRTAQNWTRMVHQELGCIALEPDSWMKRWEMTNCKFTEME